MSMKTIHQISQTRICCRKKRDTSDWPTNLDMFKHKGIHLIHFNTGSLLPKISELRTIALETQATIIAISETWLDDSVTDTEILLPGYNIIRSDRDRSGGGVCTYIRNNRAYTPRDDLVKDGMESVWIELNLPDSKPIIVGTVYRPPKESAAKFNVGLEAVISSISSDHEIVMLGDFNICILKDHDLAKNYTRTLKSLNLRNLICEKTRITDSSASCIDHIITNISLNKIANSGTIDIGLSDHLPVFCTYKSTKIKFNSHKSIKFRCMKNYNQDSYLDKRN